MQLTGERRQLLIPLNLTRDPGDCDKQQELERATEFEVTIAFVVLTIAQGN